MTDSLRAKLEPALAGEFVIEHELGGGGMSRVFVAHDKRLARRVVVKVLPSDAGGVFSGERFQREIAVAASLQHPHIVPVLSSGDVGGVPYYVMPFVEGESLRQRLDREGELSVSDSVTILREVARALVYAHDRGIVHRDIKPGNIMLSGGAAMVVDFGVAKAISASAAPSSASHSGGLTQLGMALGTPAYMAPEQAAADPAVDARADLYALGCVAYEMLTGSPPFSGRPNQALLSAQVNEEPEPIARRRPRIPPTLAALIMQCLEKRPADRPRNAAEFLRMLDAVSITPGGTLSSATRARAPGQWRDRFRHGAPYAMYLVAATALVAAGALWSHERDGASATETTVRFVVTAPPGLRLGATGAEPIAVSPDGRTLAFIASNGATSQIWLRSTDDVRPAALAGTDGAQMPFFSPDGAWIGYFTADKLRKVRLSDGRSSDIANLPGPAFGGAWTKSGTIVVGFPTGGGRADSTGQGLLQIAEDGGSFKALTRPPAGEAHFSPHILPDGETVLFARADLARRVSTLAIASVRTGKYRAIEGATSRPVGIWNANLVWINSSSSLVAAPFDQGAARITGEALTIVDAVTTGAALSANGTLVYASRSPRSTVASFDVRSGTARPVFDEPRNFAAPRVSPDGRRVSLTIVGPTGSTDVWLGDIASGTLTRVSSDGRSDQAEWLGNNRLIFRRRLPGHPGELRVQRIDSGGGSRTLFAPAATTVSEADASGDGHWIVYRAGDLDPRAARGIWLAPIARDTVSGAPRAVVEDAFRKVGPRLSPNGRWVAYASVETGRSEVYVRPTSGGTNTVQVSADGGSEPMWSPDGTQLFFRAGAALVSARVSDAATFRVESRQSLVAEWPASRGPSVNWDARLDATTFVLLRPEESDDQLNVVVAWGAEITQRGKRQP